MAVINFARREIITRIVYFGAPGAGTTSNVRWLYTHGRWRTEGPLLPFGPEDSEQTHFFQFVPDEQDLPGFSLLVRVYSLPGALADRAHREEIVRDADAIVLVADARPGRNEGNIDALLDLDRLLKDLEIELSELPMVFQVNHTDHDEAESVREVVYDLNPYNHPTIPARASEGIGVEETMSRLLEDVVRQVKGNLAGQPSSLHVHAIHRREATGPEEVVAAHERAIALARTEEERENRKKPERPWTRSSYDILPTGLSVQVPYQPPELMGMRPVHILDTRLDQEEVYIDLVLDDAEAAHPTRLRVALVPPSQAMNTPTRPDMDQTPHSDGTVPAVPTRQEITTTIPDRIEIVSRSQANGHGLWYGVAGAAVGILAGLLLGFLLWG